MTDVKLLVIYPRPKDVDIFEKIYQDEHVPLAVAKLDGKTKIVATKILGSPQGTAPFCRIAGVYFPSFQALEACVASKGDKEALAHAVKISSGGAPIFLVAEEETLTFTKTVNAQGRTDACQTINQWIRCNFPFNDDAVVSIHSCCGLASGSEPR
jgi:uncharacterized protein (TIGR02118 family)